MASHSDRSSAPSASGWPAGDPIDWTASGDLQFRLLVEGVTDYAIFMLDVDGNVLTWNAGAARAKGYDASEIIGRSFTTFYTPEDCTASKPQALLRLAVECGVARDEGWRVRKDGTRFLANVTVTALRDDCGALRGFAKVTRDVTDRYKTEAIRRDAERKVRTIYDSAVQFIGLLSPVGAVLDANAAALSIIDLPLSAVVGRPFWECPWWTHDREAQEQCRLAVRRAAGGETVRMQSRHVAPDGRGIDVDFSLTPLLDDDGCVTYLIPEGRDVTSIQQGRRDLAHVHEQLRRANANLEERVRDRTADLAEATASLRDRETEMRFLADCMPDMVWTTDPDGGANYYNRRFFEYTGLRFEEAKDWGWRRMLHPDDVEHCTAAWTSSLSTGKPYEVEYRFRRASDGEYRWHLGRALPRRDAAGAIIEWVGTCTDIHDQKRIAAELREASAMLEARVTERTLELRAEKRFVDSVLDHITDGIVVCDTAGRITYLNRSLRRTLGIGALPPGTSPAWAGEHLALYDPHTGEPVRWDDRPLARALRNVAVDDAEFTVRTSSGVERRMMISSRPMTVDDGQVHGAVAVWHDVSELRRSQNELFVAKEAAEAANQSKGEFLANISHEIRTPMTAIIGYADLLADRCPDERERAEFVQIIRRNGEHLLHIINDVLDLSKVEAGKLRLERLAVSPRQLAADVESLMRGRATQKDIAFDVEVQAGVPEVICSDPTRLRQVLMNLVSNAVKFTSAGGVRVVVSGDTGARTVRFEVSDTGIGLTPGQLGALFKPFAQADSSTTRRFGGTGLGLAISKRLVDMLGGCLSVVSEPGRGSTFTVAFKYDEVALGQGAAPLASAPSRPVTSDQPVGDLRGRILVAEDSADNRRLVMVYLEEAGLTVEWADNGRAAVDMVVAADDRGEPYDCVLMDMQMPELDGYAATREVRARGLTRLPIIAFTAHAMASEREKCMLAGCDAYATKPVDPGSLIATIAAEIERVRRPGEVPAPLPPDAVRSEFADRRAIAKILPAYVAGLPAQVAGLTGHLARGERDELRRVAHQVRGAAGGYGFPGISRLAEAVECAVDQVCGTAGIERLTGELVAAMRRVEGYDLSAENRGDAAAAA